MFFCCVKSCGSKYNFCELLWLTENLGVILTLKNIRSTEMDNYQLQYPFPSNIPCQILYQNHLCFFCEYLSLNRDRRGGYFFLKLCSFKQYQEFNVEPWCSQLVAGYMVKGVSWRNSWANISFLMFCMILWLKIKYINVKICGFFNRFILIFE